MTDLSERAAAKADIMRAYARLGDERPRRTGAAATARVVDDTVTLDKIGDFLELDLRRFTVWLRSGLMIILALAVVGAVSGAIYSMLSKPRYTVSTDVLIDPNDLQLFDAELFAASGQLGIQLLVTGSKVRVMTSRNVLERVAADLELADDPEFYDPNAFSLKGLIGLGQPAADPQAAAVESLGARVATKLDEASFVVTLSVSAQTTEKAIAISAAMIDAFKDELDAAEADSAAQASAALDDRLSQLRNDVQVAEERVETFKRENSLASSNGQLVASQSLTQVNTELMAAQSRSIAARANYEALLTGGADAGTDPVAFASLAALREKASALQQQFTSQSMIYGPRHPAIASLSAELAIVRQQVETALAQALQSAQAGADQADAVVASLMSRVDELTTDAFADGDLQVQLRELERDAAAKSSVYENFLSRERQVAELEQISTANVRTISTAVPPEGRAWPPGVVVMAFVGGMVGLVLGLMLAVVFGVLRDMRRSPAAIGQ